MSATDQQPPHRPAESRAVPAVSPVVSRTRPVHRFLGRLHEVLDDLSTEAWALTPDELSECLKEAYAGQARLAALTLDLVAQADRSDLPAHEAAPSLVAWLREHTLIAPSEAKRQVKLARALDQHETTREALARGAFPAASAEVIVTAVDRLPGGADGISLEVRERAEQHLAGEAHHHDTTALRRLAVHLDEVIDPDGADQRLAEQLAAADAKAERKTYLTVHHDEVNQLTYGTFCLPMLHGLKTARMLDSLTNPARPDPIPFQDPVTGQTYTADQRRGLAFCELLDRFPVKRLPKYGGSAPTVVVMMDYTTLIGGLRAAHVDTGQVISPGAARRLAAECGVIPAIMGSDSQVLDLGRKHRLMNTPQRLAKLVEQHGTCAVAGCTRSAVGADGAHLVAWSAGGLTDLIHLALLCQRHHTYADHPHYQVIRLGPGRIRIERRR